VLPARCWSIPALLLRRDTAKDAELLVLHVNTVLRRQLKSPVRYEHADRFWLATLSALIPRRCWGTVFAVTPGILAADLGTRMDSLRFVLRDRDTKYIASFDAVFEADSMDILLSTAGADNSSGQVGAVIADLRILGR
jgi:hypothetical protein